MPMLELPLSGQKLCQTRAILRYLGSLHGYYTIEDPKYAWQIDSIVDSCADAVAKLSSFVTEEDR